MEQGGRVSVATTGTEGDMHSILYTRVLLPLVLHVVYLYYM